jgi:hypothetical protein
MAKDKRPKRIETNRTGLEEYLKGLESPSETDTLDAPVSTEKPAVAPDYFFRDKSLATGGPKGLERKSDVNLPYQPDTFESAVMPDTNKAVKNLDALSSEITDRLFNFDKKDPSQRRELQQLSKLFTSRLDEANQKFAVSESTKQPIGTLAPELSEGGKKLQQAVIEESQKPATLGKEILGYTKGAELNMKQAGEYFAEINKPYYKKVPEYVDKVFRTSVKKINNAFDNSLDSNLIERTADLTLGVVGTGLNAIMLPMHIVTPASNEIGRQISEVTGNEEVGNFVAKYLPFSVMPNPLAFAGASLGSDVATDEIMNFLEDYRISDKNKERIAEGLGLGTFILTHRLITHGVRNVQGRELLRKEIEKGTKNYTPEGIQYFKERLSDPATTPNEKQTILNILRKEGVKLEDIEIPAGPTEVKGLLPPAGKKTAEKFEDVIPTQKPPKTPGITPARGFDKQVFETMESEEIVKLRDEGVDIDEGIQPGKVFIRDKTVKDDKGSVPVYSVPVEHFTPEKVIDLISRGRKQFGKETEPTEAAEKDIEGVAPAEKIEPETVEAAEIPAEVEGVVENKIKEKSKKSEVKPTKEKADVQKEAKVLEPAGETKAPAIKTAGDLQKAGTIEVRQFVKKEIGNEAFTKLMEDAVKNDTSPVIEGKTKEEMQGYAIDAAVHARAMELVESKSEVKSQKSKEKPVEKSKIDLLKEKVEAEGLRIDGDKIQKIKGEDWISVTDPKTNFTRVLDTSKLEAEIKRFRKEQDAGKAEAKAETEKPDQTNKVVDESGKPKTVYHETNAKFDTFNKNKRGSGQGNDFGGIWFADKRGYFAEAKDRIIEAEISIKNPAGDVELKQAMLELPDNLQKNKGEKSNWYRNYFTEKGFDGIILKNGEYAVFDESQIKIKEKPDRIQQLKQKIYDNLQYLNDKKMPGSQRTKAKNEAKLQVSELMKAGVTAQLKLSGGKWDLMIDNVKQNKRSLGLVEMAEKVDLAGIEHKTEVKKPFKELPLEIRDRQEIIAEAFVEAEDLPSGSGEKVLKQGLADIKQNDGKETSLEAMAVRDAAEIIFNNGKRIIAIAHFPKQELQKEDIWMYVDAQIEEKAVRELNELEEADEKERISAEAVIKEADDLEKRLDAADPEERNKAIGEIDQVAENLFGEAEKLGYKKKSVFAEQTSFAELAKARVPEKGITGEGKSEETTPLFQQKTEDKAQSKMFIDEKEDFIENVKYITKSMAYGQGTDFERTQYFYDYEYKGKKYSLMTNNKIPEKQVRNKLYDHYNQRNLEINAEKNPHLLTRDEYEKIYKGNLNRVYPYSVRDLLETKEFKTVNELLDSFKKYFDEATDDAKSFLRIGLSYSAEKLYKKNQDPDARFISENAVNFYSKIEDKFFTTEPVAESEDVGKKKPKDRIVSEETYQAAKKRLGDPKNIKLGAGVDPVEAAKVVKDFTIIGTYHFENGLRDFKQWSKKMVADYGTKIQQYLKGIWEDIHAQYKEFIGNPFFYNSERKIFEKMPDNASVQQVKDILKEVSEDEIKWLGVDEYLAKHTGEKIKKQDLLNFLKANELKIEEVDKSDIHPTKYYLEIHPYSGNWEVKDKNNPQFSATFGDREKAQAYLDNIQGKRIDTKYSQYTLPGGENYREILFTLPEKNVEELLKKPEPVHITEIDRSGKYSFKVKFSDGTSSEVGKGVVGDFASDQLIKTYFKNIIDEKQAKATSRYEEYYKKETGKTNFKSSHWDEPNVFAHARVNDRTTADGKKILFIEELQSDWALKGRKEGYKTEIKDLPEGYKIGQMGAGDLYSVWDKDGRVIVSHIQGNNFQDAKKNAIKELNNTTGVPDMPFKNNWHEFELKRLLREAAEKGYDGIGWITGEQTAERYNLSKYVEGIEYQDNLDGTYYVFAKEKETGRSIIERFNVSKSELESIVGKEVANKIIEGIGETTQSEVDKRIRKRGKAIDVFQKDDKWYIKYEDGTSLGTYGKKEDAMHDMQSQNKDFEKPIHKKLEGDDLKVGGAWATNLYDKVIPNFLNKYGKKWGAEVGETNINGEYNPLKATNNQDKIKVHFLPITEAMMQSVVTSGQPMFGKESTRVISDKSYEQAMKNLREKGQRLTAGIDPTMIKDLITVGAYKIENGLIKLADWLQEMKREHPKLEDADLRKIFIRSKKLVDIANEKRKADLLKDAKVPEAEGSYPPLTDKDIERRDELIKKLKDEGLEKDERKELRKLTPGYNVPLMNPDNADMLPKTLEEMRKDFDKMRNVKLSMEQVKKQALKYAEKLTDQDILDIERGEAKNPVEAMAIRLYTESRVKDVYKQVEDLKDNPDVDESRMAQEDLERAIYLYMKGRSVYTTAGQTVKSADILADDDLMNVMSAIRDKFKETNPYLAEITEELIKLSDKPGWQDYLQRLLYESVLSNPFTDVANTFGNTSFLGAELASRIIAGTNLNSIRKGLTAGHKAGIDAMVKVYNGQMTADSKFTEQYKKFELIKADTKGKRIGRLILPTTRLAMEDAYFKAMAVELEKSISLRKIAKDNKINYDDVVKEMEAVLNDPDLADPKKLRNKAEYFRKYADYLTFQTELGTIGKGIQKISTLSGNDSAVTTALKLPLKLSILFVRTPANILKAGFDFSPAGFLRLTNKTLMPEERAAFTKRALAGTIFYSAIATAMAMGLLEVTGQGPDDEDQKDVWMKRGYRPNHIYLRWIDGSLKGFSYQNINPFNVLFGFIGNLSDAYKYDKNLISDDKDASEKLAIVLRNMTLTMSDQTYLKGVSNFFQWMQYGNENFLQDLFVMPAIPGILSFPKTTAEYWTGDKTVYNARNLGERIQRKIGLTGGLEPMPDVSGEPKQSGWERFPFPIKSVDKKGKELETWYNENLINLPQPGEQTKIGNSIMIEKQYLDYKRKSNKRIWENMIKNFPRLKKMTVEDAQDWIDDMVRDERKFAKEGITRDLDKYLAGKNSYADELIILNQIKTLKSENIKSKEFNKRYDKTFQKELK